MSLGAAGVDPGSAPDATGARNSNKIPTTTDNDLFTRAVSKYRDAFLEQHSHLAEDERLRLWTQQLPQFIDGTSNVPNLIPYVQTGRFHFYDQNALLTIIEELYLAESVEVLASLSHQPSALRWRTLWDFRLPLPSNLLMKLKLSAPEQWTR